MGMRYLIHPALPPCSLAVKKHSTLHAAQKTSVSYYSQTKPKKETRTSLFHSSSVIILLDKASITCVSSCKSQYNVQSCSLYLRAIYSTGTITHSSLLNTLKWDFLILVIYHHSCKSSSYLKSAA